MLRLWWNIQLESIISTHRPLARPSICSTTLQRRLLRILLLFAIYWYCWYRLQSRRGVVDVVLGRLWCSFQFCCVGGSPVVSVLGLQLVVPRRVWWSRWKTMVVGHDDDQTADDEWEEYRRLLRRMSQSSAIPISNPPTASKKDGRRWRRWSNQLLVGHVVSGAYSTSIPSGTAPAQQSAVRQKDHGLQRVVYHRPAGSGFLSVVFEVTADGVEVLRDCTASTSATSLGYHLLFTPTNKCPEGLRPKKRRQPGRLV
jgi:hypothetical protein